MGFQAAAAAIAATATVAGTAYQIDQSREAEDAQEEAREAERAQNEIENARKRRRAIAQQRIQLGQINNAAAVSNTVGSSGPRSAAGAVVGDSGAGMASFNSSIASRNNQLNFLGDANQAQSNAQLGGTIAGLGAQFGGTNLNQFLNNDNSVGTPDPVNSTGRSFSYGNYNSGVTFRQTG